MARASSSSTRVEDRLAVGDAGQRVEGRLLPGLRDAVGELRERGTQPPVADPLRVGEERRAVDVGAREALRDPGEAAVLQPDDEQGEPRGARQRPDERDDEREGKGGGEGVQDASRVICRGAIPRGRTWHAEAAGE